MYHLLELAVFVHQIGEKPENYRLYTTEHVHLCDLRFIFTRLDSALTRFHRRIKYNRCDDIPF